MILRGLSPTERFLVLLGSITANMVHHGHLAARHDAGPDYPATMNKQWYHHHWDRLNRLVIQKNLDRFYEGAMRRAAGYALDFVAYDDATFERYKKEFESRFSLGMTMPPGEIEFDEIVPSKLLGHNALADRLGVSRQALMGRRARGTVPKPWTFIEGHPYWYADQPGLNPDETGQK